MHSQDNTMAAMSKRRTGLLGGTVNPIWLGFIRKGPCPHCGHDFPDCLWPAGFPCEGIE